MEILVNISTIVISFFVVNTIFSLWCSVLTYRQRIQDEEINYQSENITKLMLKLLEQERSIKQLKQEIENLKSKH